VHRTAAEAHDPLAAFDLLATMVAVVQPDGLCLHANAAFEKDARAHERVGA